MDMLASSFPISTFPPSSTVFWDDIAESVMKPMLEFLSRTKSYFFMDVYPYFSYSFDPYDVPLEYANFGDHDKLSSTLLLFYQIYKREDMQGK